MKKNLLSGFILLLPLAITLIVIIFLVDLLTTPFLGYMESFLQFFGELYSVDLVYHHTILVVLSRIIILILLFFFVLLLGFLANRIFFNWIMKLTHTVMLKIPLISSVYRICKDIISAILSEKRKVFSRIVVVPFPCKESRTLGLVTGNAPHDVQAKGHETRPDKCIKTVFVPTSPHPTSGFLLFVEEERLTSLNLSFEDALKYLISCGMFTPDHKQENAPPPIPPLSTPPTTDEPKSPK